jgi:hypothetical protein
MQDKIHHILKILEQEKSQNYIKKLNTFFSLIAVFFMINIILNSRVRSLELDFSYIFIGFVHIFLLYILFLIWKKFLSQNKIESNTSYFENWALSNVNKYIPGGIGLTITRFSVSKNLNKDTKKIFYGLLEEQLRGAILVIPFLLVSMVLENKELRIYFYIACYILTLLFISRISITYSRKLGFISVFKNNQMLLIISNFTQIAFNYSILSTVIDKTMFDILYLAIIYSVTVSLSLVFIGSPAGLGIREIIFYFYSSNLLSNDEIILFLLAARAIMIFSDFIFLAGSKLLIKFT